MATAPHPQSNPLLAAPLAIPVPLPGEGVVAATPVTGNAAASPTATPASFCAMLSAASHQDGHGRGSATITGTASALPVIAPATAGPATDPAMAEAVTGNGEAMSDGTNEADDVATATPPMPAAPTSIADALSLPLIAGLNAPMPVVVATPVELAEVAQAAPRSAATPQPMAAMVAPHTMAVATGSTPQRAQADALLKALVPGADTTTPANGPIEAPATPLNLQPLGAPWGGQLATAMAGTEALAQPTPNALVDFALDAQLAVDSDGAWLDQIATDIARIAGESGRARFRLSPDNLGELIIAVERHADGTHVHFTVETEAARDLISDAQNRLLLDARANGVALRDSSVSLASNRADTQPDGTSQGSAHGQTQNQTQSQNDRRHAPAGDRTADPSRPASGWQHGDPASANGRTRSSPSSDRYA